jgi:hypothetical protein
MPQRAKKNQTVPMGVTKWRTWRRALSEKHWLLSKNEVALIWLKQSHAVWSVTREIVSRNLSIRMRVLKVIG